MCALVNNKRNCEYMSTCVSSSDTEHRTEIEKGGREGQGRKDKHRVHTHHAEGKTTYTRYARVAEKRVRWLEMEGGDSWMLFPPSSAPW